VTAFNLEAATRLAAPQSLSDTQRQALDRATAASMPTAAEEIWRYSRIAELDLGAFTPRADQATVTGPSQYVTSVVAAEAEPGAGGDIFDDLNLAFSAPIVVRVPRGTVVDEPITIEHRYADSGSAAFPRLIIEAGEDSEFSVVERFSSPDDISALVVAGVELRIANSARVKYLSVNELGTGTWLVAHQTAVADRDSSTLLATVSLGGDYARVRTDAVAAGIGADVRQIAIYFADGTQMHDFRTMQRHSAPKTSSNLLFKGAVNDTARSVYTGLIRIDKNAKGTVAFQTNRNLTLSAGAWAESVPNLDIETNDVKCSHASTVGPVDADQRFYLESRGVPPDVAERLIVLGFFDEVLDQLPPTPLTDGLRAKVAAKLDRRVKP
jgi:Fe-S cluster assembly protein SufD